jgi:multiple sugar transport system substrate-binding protein
MGAFALIPALVATACSSNGTSGASPSAGANSMSGTVKVWTYLTTPEQLKLLDDYQKAFTAKYPNAKVEYTNLPADQLTQKVIAAAATNSGPDVLVGDPSAALQLATSGLMADMTPQWSKFSDASQFPDSVLIKANGKLIGVQGYVNTLALWYNQDALNKVGVQPPTTMSDLASDLAAVTAAGYHGLALCGKPTIECEFQAYPWMLGQGVTYDSFDTTGATNVFDTFKGFIDKGYVPKEVVSWDQTAAMNDFLAGKSAFTENGNWQITGAKAAKFQYGVVRLPAGPAGSHVVGGGEAESVMAGAKNKDLAFAYLATTLFSRDGQIAALKAVGSLPTRKDAAQDPAVSSDPIVSVYVAAVSESGSWPANAGIADARQAMGTAWSSVLAGQLSPSAAATQLAGQIQKALG